MPACTASLNVAEILSHTLLLYVLVFAVNFGCGFCAMTGKVSTVPGVEMDGVWTVDASDHHVEHRYTCQPLTINFCKGVPYNRTQFPNSLEQLTQEEAAKKLQEFSPLIRVNCSKDLKFFLCSLYAPICTGYHEILKPCRSLCMSAKRGCSGIMAKFGYEWPPDLDCDQPEKFPIHGGGKICIYTNETVNNAAPSGPNRFEPKSKPSGSVNTNSDKNFGRGSEPIFPNANGDPFDTSPTVYPWDGESSYPCPTGLRTMLTDSVQLPDHRSIPNCGLPCNQTLLFSKDLVLSMRGWIIACACLCTLSTAFTLLTFFIDRKRFVYPEKAVIFISFCYFVVGLTYIAGYSTQLDAACNLDTGKSSGRNTALISQGARHHTCAILAMFAYFFTVSGALWWVVLTITWFLEAVLKWGQEAVDAKAYWYHLIGWGLSSLLTLSVLASSNIDGDLHSGVCSVGNWNRSVMNGFVVAPLAACLVTGALLFVLGYVSLFRIRSHFIKDSSAAQPQLLSSQGAALLANQTPTAPIAGGNTGMAYDLALHAQPNNPLLLQQTTESPFRYPQHPLTAYSYPPAQTMTNNYNHDNYPGSAGRGSGASVPPLPRPPLSRPTSTATVGGSWTKNRVQKVERLMMKMSIFALLYTVPTSLLISCYLYQSFNIEQWMLRWYDEACVHQLYGFDHLFDNKGNSFVCPSVSNAKVFGRTDLSAKKVPQFEDHRPLVWVFVAKYVLPFSVGICTACWICSSKTGDSWRNFFSTLTRSCGRGAGKHYTAGQPATTEG